ncbi:hypothetical protein ABPG77_006614 [Micractinium sp. CCAP 211/92]
MAALHPRVPGGTARWRPPFNCSAAVAVALLVQLLLPLLARSESICVENGSQVLFGNGNMAFDVATTSPDGKFHPDQSNSLNVKAACTISGGGASTAANRWRAQLYYCGTGGPCNDANLPRFNATSALCGTPPCNLAPTGAVTYQDGSINQTAQYEMTYTNNIENAWKGTKTFYYVKCFYLCGGDANKAQDRAGASLIVDAPLPSPPPPSPPPSPPPPPPAAAFWGFATATISSPLKDPVLGVIWGPASNVVPVTATCIVSGQYALLSKTSWPAQVLICGNPPGSDVCSSTDYNPSVPVLQPDAIKYDEHSQVYTATYSFNLTNALVTPPVTYRYLTCLYGDSTTGIAKRAGASLDVVVARPPPSPPKPSPPPPPSPSPPPPAQLFEPGAGLLVCSCSAVTGLHVGFVLVGGVQYVSTVGIECGSGELLRDPLAARINLTGTLPSRVCASPEAGGGCASLTGSVVGIPSGAGQLLAFSRLQDAGLAGTSTQTMACPTGQVITSLGVARYLAGPLRNAAKSVTVGCARPRACPPPPASPPPLPPPRPVSQTTTSSPPPPPPPIRRAPPPIVNQAHGWGDPHFLGFDKSRFDFHGAPGTWKELLGVPKQQLHLRTQFSAGTKVAHTTYMRVFEFDSGRSSVRVDLLPPLPAAPGVWRITAKADGRPMRPGTLKLGGGVDVTYVPSQRGKHGRVEIEQGNVRIVVIQKWRPNRLVLADFLDLNIAVTGILPLPVTGLLGPSYVKALRASTSGARASAAALPTFTAAVAGGV